MTASITYLPVYKSTTFKPSDHSICGLNSYAGIGTRPFSAALGAVGDMAQMPDDDDISIPPAPARATCTPCLRLRLSLLRLIRRVIFGDTPQQAHRKALITAIALGGSITTFRSSRKGLRA